MIHDDDDTGGAPYGTSRDDKIVREARARFERVRSYESVAMQNFKDDMRFANGDSLNNYQWDDAIRQGRGERPCLTVNKTRTHNLHIVNDARQNKPEIRISPVGEGASYEASQIYEGLCRHIQYISNASQAYDTATYNQVYGGIGYWRVLTDYAHDDTMDQEIFIRRIPDPTGVYLDPDIQQYDGSDAKWGFVFRDMTREDYRAEYPRAAADDTVPTNAGAIGETGGWADDKHVRVVEYYRMSDKADTLHRLSNGQTVRASAIPKGALAHLAAAGVTVAESREVSDPQVEWFLIAADKIIDRKDWPGRYIPIVRVPCEEIVIDGKIDRVSHTRHLRDPQRLYNWYTSSAAEFVALQGKAPFIGTVEAIEGNKRDWETANITNHAVLTYKGTDDNGQPIPRPERAPPPVMAEAYMEGLKISQAEMMMASGQYQAIMGAPSNETSGKAINARQRQGDTATYHVIDHLAVAIRFTGRILIDLIPRVYNTQRVMQIIDETGATSTVHIDPQAADAHATVPDPDAPPPQLNPQGQPDPEQAKRDAVKTIFNPNVGRYEVVADVGPSYATKRQQAFDAFSQIMANNHAAFAIVGDFWAANADFPGADELQARLKLGLPPQYKGAPPPEVIKAQQQLQMTQQQAHTLLGKADAELAALKQQLQVAQAALKDKDAKNQIDDYRAETDRLAALGTVDPVLVQMIARQLWENINNTSIAPHIANHTALEQAMMPPDPAALNGLAAVGQAN